MDLSFGVVNIIKPNLAEVIINENITFDVRMVKQYHEALINNLTAPFDLLINKLNYYNYSPAARTEIGSIPQINKMGVVNYDVKTVDITKDLIKSPRNKSWNIKLFNNRAAALKWLTQDSSLCVSQILSYLEEREYYTREERSELRKYFRGELRKKSIL